MVVNGLKLYYMLCNNVNKLDCKLELVFDLRLAGKVAIITGAARGIGRAIAEEFAREGAKVAIVDILESEARKAAEEIRSLGAEVLPIRADVSKRDEVRRVVEEVVSRFGRIDILVNNAGIFSSASLDELTEEQWDRVMAKP